MKKIIMILFMLTFSAPAFELGYGHSEETSIEADNKHKKKNRNKQKKKKVNKKKKKSRKKHLGDLQKGYV